jgi:hypothetical protein
VLKVGFALALALSATAFTLPAGATGSCASATPAKWRPWSNVLHGDVTGDGRPDTVFVGQRYPERPLCRRLLFVRTGTKTLVEPIVQRELDWVFEVATPAPAALLSFDRVRGAEILVILHWSGDGHASYGLYTVRRGEIVRYRVPSADDMLLGGGGSAGLPAALMCVRPHAGLFVQSGAGAVGRKFEVEREFLRAKGLELIVARKQDVVVTDLSVLPEFRGRGGCATTAARNLGLPKSPKEPVGG